MSTTIDQQFIEYIVKSLVSKPDDVKVERRIDEKGVLLELTVDQEDLGRVIGKRGATAQSLRTLLRALGTKNDARYNLKIVDVGGGSSSRSAPADDDDKDETESDDEAPEPSESDDEPEKDREEGESETDTETEKESDRFNKTRKELAELDDLDV